jgi:hypothetical protein
MLNLISSYQGGLHAIAQNQRLRSTMSWVELRGAYMLDLPPQLPLPETWTVEADGPLCIELIALDLGEQWADCCPSAARRIYHDLVHFSPRVADDVANPCIDYNTLKLPLWTNVVIFDLLTLRPLDDRPLEVTREEDLLAEVFRLAMLLYMDPIWRFYGSHPTHTRMILRKLDENLEAYSGLLNSSPTSQKLQAWVLCMGAFEADVAEEQSLRNDFVSALARLPLSEGRILEDARSALWIHGLFDQQAAALEEDMKRMTLT